MQLKTFDILIVGSGIIGTTLALALAKTTSLSIALIENADKEVKWDKNIYYHRVSAITPASKQILNLLAVWSDIAKQRLSPFRQISVWDEASNTILNFAAEEIAQAYLGYIVENNLLQVTLTKAITDYPNIQKFLATELVTVQWNNHAIMLFAKDKKCYQAKLAIAADGANSWLRRQSQITVTKKDYEETAIVTHVTTEYPHQQIARQVFTHEGPLAFLPLKEPSLSSIVWTLPKTKADILVDLPKLDFMYALQTAFADRLGRILDITDRYKFPLYFQSADRYVANRVVLVGDAAHTVHPLAGQGINMGLLDVATLVEIITTAVAANRDYANPYLLKKYERWRRADNAELMWGIDLLHNLFANDNVIVPALRAFGLKACAKLPVFKKLFMQHAIGMRSRMPQLAR